MKIKKHTGALLLLLANCIITAGVASALTIGNEDMPQSMKNTR